MVSPAVAAIILCFCSILAPVAPTPIPPSTITSDSVSGIPPNPSSLQVPTQTLNANLDIPWLNTPTQTVAFLRQRDLDFADPASACSTSGTRSTSGTAPPVQSTPESDVQNEATAEKFFEAVCLWRHKNWPREIEEVDTVDSIRNEYTKNGRINYIDIMLDKVALQSHNHESIQDNFHFDGNFVLNRVDRESYNRQVAYRFFSKVLEIRRLEAEKQGQHFYPSFQDIKRHYTARNSRILYHKIEIEASNINFPYKFDFDVQTKAANIARASKNSNTVVSFCKALRRWYNQNRPTDPIATFSDQAIKDKFRVQGRRGVGNGKRIDFQRMEDEIRQKGLKDGNGAPLKFDIP
ncbi:hypothetical protein H0H93_007300 [Arthromyces matolae]|nr:hypothetical protein H0H93_007300 [Arthromyces matolae]